MIMDNWPAHRGIQVCSDTGKVEIVHYRLPGEIVFWMILVLFVAMVGIVYITWVMRVTNKLLTFCDLILICSATGVYGLLTSY